MDVSTVSTADHSLLRGVRSTLTQADEALLCVAFASEAGVNLLRKEFSQLGGNTRLLATTVFGRGTPPALNAAVKRGVQVKVLNPGASSTYHPKLNLGRGDHGAAAVVGSANLTGGLVNNVEVAALLQGNPQDTALRDAWSWAEKLWSDDRSEVWIPREPGVKDVERFHSDLYKLIKREVAREPVFMTLGSKPKENRVVELTPTEMYIATARSMQSGTGAEPVPAWMINLAWDYLRQHGSLSNPYLLNELRVHRSSAVLAVLARLPLIEQVGRSPITLEWRA